MKRTIGKGVDVVSSERLAALLVSSSFEQFDELPTAEIRALRRECESAEHGVSYARRIIQGKLDILRAEALRRRSNGGPDLLAQLPEVLGDRVTARLPNNRAVRLLPPRDVQEYVTETDDIGNGALLSIRERTDDELEALAVELAEKERQLSDVRRELFARIDLVQSELMRRYKAGAADVREVLHG